MMQMQQGKWLREGEEKHVWKVRMLLDDPTHRLALNLVHPLLNTAEWNPWLSENV